MTIGDDAAVALETVDNRANPALGSLEKREGPPAEVTTDRDPAYILKLTVAKTLRDYGFRPGLWDDSAQPRLLVGIEKLNITVDSTLPYDINTEVVLSARAWRDGKTFEGQATANLSDVSPTRPNAEKTAGYLNKAITQALQRLFEDKLPRFLAGRS
jgi:hypothetical protein